MTARDELLRRVAGSFIDEDRANALIDAYAHELAEQIRGNTAHLEGNTTGNSIRRIVNELAADLIDPEVTP